VTFEEDRKRFPGGLMSKPPKKGKKASVPRWQKDLNVVLEGFNAQDGDEEIGSEDEDEDEAEEDDE
jgi:hypothetical protein